MLLKAGKLPLKLLVLLLFLLCAAAGILAKLAMRLSLYLIGPLMLFLLGCGIYTATKQQWSQTLLLFLLEAVCTCAVFGASWVIRLLDAGSEKLLELLAF